MILTWTRWDETREFWDTGMRHLQDWVLDSRALMGMGGKSI
jgi:hypothetical protein